MENNDKIEKISSYIDSELSSEERKELESMLREDVQLQEDLEAFRRIDALYRSLEKKRAPSEFQQIVRKKLERSPRAIRFRRPGLKQKPVWHLVAAAACLVLVLAATLYQLSLFTRNTSRFTVSLNRDTAPQASPSAAAKTLSANQESDKPRLEKSDTSVSSSENAVLEPFESQPATTGDKTLNTIPPVRERFESYPETSAPPAPMEPEMAPPQSGTMASTSPVPSTMASEMAPPQSDTTASEILARKRASFRSAAKDEALSSGRLGSEEGWAEKTLPWKSGSKVQAEESNKEIVRHLEGRDFIFQENEWRERGYSGEETLSLSRDAKETSQFFSQHAPLAPILQWKEPVVFRTDSRWYRLK